MTSFWIVAALMIVAALAFLAPALLGRGRMRSQDRNEQNVQIARERLNELESEFGRGVLSETDYERAKQELEQALLNDVSEQSPSDKKALQKASPITLAILIVLIPLFTILMYLDLGKPQLVQTAAESNTATQSPHATSPDGKPLPSIEELLVKLEDKLRTNPNDAQGWYMLGRSYMSLGRHSEAAEALRRSYELVGDQQPVVMLSYADALAMSQDGRISGKPFELILKALEITPNDPTALWLAGMGYEEQGQYEQAVRHWRQLEPMLAGNPESQNEVRKLIATAELKLGHTVEGSEPELKQAISAPASSIAIKVHVDISPKVRDKASPDDTVFIFARALSGPPMPLAVVRKQVRDLPVDVTLDDSMAMMPQLKLSNYSEVKVNARISKNNSPMPAAGDLQATATEVQTDVDQVVQLNIDGIIP